ncbi:hypothetical protein COOONC_18477 [Cooperia oncophora]
MEMNPFSGMPYSERYWQLLEKRRQLPIWEHKEKFMKMLDDSQCVIVAGEPGTGKTTQVPQWCAEYAHQKAITNQPKLVACTQNEKSGSCIKLAKPRVADEMDVQKPRTGYLASRVVLISFQPSSALGQELGYSIRFEDCTSAKTVLKYCTDGINPTLDGYGIIILDEIDERALYTDVLIALLKELINKRNDIKIVILSATHTGGKILRHFEDYRTITIRPRAFPINIIVRFHFPFCSKEQSIQYENFHSIKFQFKEEPVENFLEAAIRAAVKIHISEDEIEEACKRIRSDLAKIDQPAGTLDCIPLYAGLSKQEVQRIFKPEPSNQPGATGRRCIIATDIAETSLIIDGIVFVIDPGFVKQKVYNPSDRTETPSVRLISKANAILRAYHAGRSASGQFGFRYKYFKV